MIEKDGRTPEVPQEHGPPYMRGASVIAISAFIIILFTGGIAYGVQSSIGGAEVVEGVLVGGVREFEISAQQWGYSPAVLKVDPGDTVRFIVSSQDIRHGFAINELEVNLSLSAAAAVKREVVIPLDIPEGTYTMYCSIFCGIGHPYMKGNIVIGEPGFEIGKFLPYIATTIMAGMFISFIIVRRREAR